MENEKNNFFIIAAIAFCIILSADIHNSIKSYQYRRLCNKYTEQLIATTEANTELTARIGRVAEITGRIKEAANSNVADARGIIETVEILRTQIKELEDCCGNFNYDDYYEYWDSYYHDEGLMD